MIGALIVAVPLLLLRLSQKQYIDRTKDMVQELREKNVALEEDHRRSPFSMMDC